MRKQNNFRLSKTKNNILYILSGVSLALFAGLMLFPTISESTHAEGDVPEDGISITVSDSVSANVVLFDEGDYKIAKDTVSVSSSAPYGYELYLSTDSEEHQSIYLNNDPTSSSVISPVSGTIAEPAVLTSNTWGFAIAGQGNFDNEYSTTSPDPNSHFAIIPTTNNQAVYENTSATADDDIDFYYGIKVEPTLEPGEYTTSASYTAIAKIPPLTAKAIWGSNSNLNFVYDRNTYTVGETYTDNIGETRITNVYEVPMNSVGCRYDMDFLIVRPRTRWSLNSLITRINFDSSFRDFKPTGTCGWFNEMDALTSISNAQNLNVSNVTDMSYMFYRTGSEAKTVSMDLSDWDTGNVTTMSNMFHEVGSNATVLSLNVSNWDTKNVTDMSDMFGGAGGSATTWNIGDLSGWDVGNVEDMSYMFFRAGRDVTTWDIGDLGGWNTSNVTNMSSMFSYAGYNATTWSIGNLGYVDASHPGWNTSDVTNMSSMFSYAGYNATTWNIGDISGWDVTKVTNHSGFIRLNTNQSNASIVNNQPRWN